MWLTLFAAGLWLSLQVQAGSPRSLIERHQAGSIDRYSLLAPDRPVWSVTERAPKLSSTTLPPMLAALASMLLGTLRSAPVLAQAICLPTDCKTPCAAQPRAPPPIM